MAKIIVISPSKSTTEALGINKIGGTSLPKDSSDYLGQIMENDYQLNGRALKKSKAFTEVDLKIADYPLKEARVLVENHSAVIYLNMLSPTQVGWYMLKSNNEAPVQINYNAIAKGSKRIDSWIDSATAAYRNKNEE
ncbi:MAG: hypothetical protein IPJ38_07235 [Dechloromonas sp.]|uniref:Uncharacterized protein n=1 Tax=Candidatus Dechloromonas phosphorivorans TaxID=2899244 RepID=A0A935MYL3_9RHOO|nr:hypothetical protein [Candidatus Dechloromonas phosphorivorans]